jgi:hypothetical protein
VARTPVSAGADTHVGADEQSSPSGRLQPATDQS